MMGKASQRLWIGTMELRCYGRLSSRSVERSLRQLGGKDISSAPLPCRVASLDSRPLKQTSDRTFAGPPAFLTRGDGCISIHERFVAARKFRERRTSRDENLRTLRLLQLFTHAERKEESVMAVVRVEKDHLLTSSEDMHRAVRREGMSIAEVQRMLQRSV